MRDEMRDIDITNNSNTILMILWILLPKLWRIWKKKDVFNIYDIPFDLLPIFVLSNGWIRFVIWLVIYAVFMFVFWVISTKKVSSISNSKSES
jgi:hypothetical protein